MKTTQPGGMWLKPPGHSFKGTPAPLEKKHRITFWPGSAHDQAGTDPRARRSPLPSLGLVKFSPSTCFPVCSGRFAHSCVVAIPPRPQPSQHPSCHFPSVSWLPRMVQNSFHNFIPCQEARRMHLKGWGDVLVRTAGQK